MDSGLPRALEARAKRLEAALCHHVGKMFARDPFRARQSNRTSPFAWPRIMRSITRVPKPLRVGGLGSSSRRSGGIKMVTGLPMTSSVRCIAEKPLRPRVPTGDHAVEVLADDGMDSMMVIIRWAAFRDNQLDKSPQRRSRGWSSRAGLPRRNGDARHGRRLRWCRRLHPGQKRQSAVLPPTRAGPRRSNESRAPGASTSTRPCGQGPRRTDRSCVVFAR